MFVKILAVIALVVLLSPAFGKSVQEKADAIKLEGQLNSIKDAGFSYDDLTYESGIPAADKRLKEVIDFVNGEPGVQIVTITMKFAFLDDERITDTSYKGNGFYILGRTSDGLQSGTIYLTKRAVKRAMAGPDGLLEVLALHLCGHIWQHWVLIRNGEDRDNPEVLQKMDAKALELGADGWAGHYTNLFLKKKYASSPESLNSSINAIADAYFGAGDYFYTDKRIVTNADRKQIFMDAFNAKPRPYGPTPNANPRP